MKPITCPCCHSTAVKDESIRQDNGVFSPNFQSYLVLRLYVCTDCGVYFKPSEHANEDTRQNARIRPGSNAGL